MTITPECLACLYQQALRSCRLVGADEGQIKAVLDATADHLKTFALGSMTPPEAAVPIYGSLARIIAQSDPIAPYKESATREAEALLPFVHEKIAQASDPLDAALRAAIAGNVLDFGAQNHFDITAELDRVFQQPLAVDHLVQLKKQLSSAQRILVVGDNTGEHLFDALLLEVLAGCYPGKSLFYAVRGAPAINDVTLKEAKAARLDAHATLLDSGVDTPGLVLGRASAEFLAHYTQADLILAKGMGNFECLEAGADERIFFLFKVKCAVVAQATGQPLGSLMRMQAQSA